MKKLPIIEMLDQMDAAGLLLSEEERQTMRRWARWNAHARPTTGKSYLRWRRPGIEAGPARSRWRLNLRRGMPPLSIPVPWSDRGSCCRSRGQSRSEPDTRTGSNGLDQAGEVVIARNPDLRSELDLGSAVL